MNIAICGLDDKIANYLSAFKHLGVDLINVDKDVDVNMFDGLLLPGGGDVNPSRYNQENNGSDGIIDELDDRQFCVLDKFVKAKKPVLGICRGMQLINVYFNGSLIQDIQIKGVHRCLPNEDHDMVHDVNINKDNFLYELYGDKMISNSYHHQAVDKLGDGLIIDAYLDDIIEAIHHSSLPIYCVQFHPERMCFDKWDEKTSDGSLILKYFLKQCGLI